MIDHRGTLFAKLAAVLGEAHRIPKNGWNDFNKYHYATEGDALDVIRPLLAKHGIGIMYGVEEVQQLENARTLVKVRITLGDDTGAMLTTTAYGEARDADRNGNPQDKGLYKAITGAMKYWVLKTFLLSTGDDPEGDSGNDQAPPKKPPRSNKPSKRDRDTDPDDEPLKPGPPPPPHAYNRSKSAQRPQRGKPIGMQRAQRLHEAIQSFGVEPPAVHELAALTDAGAKDVYDKAKAQGKGQ